MPDGPCRSGSVPRSRRRRSRKCRRRSPPRLPRRPGPGRGSTGRTGLVDLAGGGVSTSQVPGGTKTAATIRLNTRGPGSSSTRITDPVMTPGKVPAMRDQSEAPTGLLLPPVPIQGTGGRDDVVEQVGRGSSHGRHGKNADLKRQQQDRARDTRGSGKHRDGITRGQGDNLSPASRKHPSTLISTGPPHQPTA